MEPLSKPVTVDTAEFVVRDLDDSKLEAAVHLWENDPAGAPLAFSLADVLGAIAARQPALVALIGESVAGAIAARVDGPRAWVLRWSVAPEYRRRGIGAELLRALERRLLALGVRDISMLVPGSSEAAETARAAGYVQHEGVLYLEQRRLQTTESEDRIEGLGGQWLPAELWESIGGMEREKDLIERRVILPLAEREEARRHGVVAASAVVLFGPPGTGKTLSPRRWRGGSAGRSSRSSRASSSAATPTAARGRCASSSTSCCTSTASWSSSTRSRRSRRAARRSRRRARSRTNC